MTRKRSLAIHRALLNHYGEPVPDLIYRDRYQLAVAVSLSAQTTDRQVNAVTPALFARFPDFHSLARARTGEVEALIQSTGFFRNKSRNIISMAQAVMERHGGRLPSTREELMGLAGIGRKTANVILSVGFGVPAFAVDTHILRIAKRIGYSDSSDPLEIEKAVTSTLPPRLWTSAHLLFIRHGRRTCVARSPRCGICPVSGLCDFAGGAP
jgi:endonuclease-3